jgi:(p)ppGpp synthase/HD superfamily hydrolase
MGFSGRYEAALTLAAIAHREQVRKGTDQHIPYLVHVVHVARMMDMHGFSEDVVAAALLHDAVEDAGLDLRIIAERCGARTARLVEALTEIKLDAVGNKRPWQQRKDERLNNLRAAGADAISIALADALHNVCTTIADVERDGAAVWQRFNQPDRLIWYYNAVLQLGNEALPGHSLVQDLQGAVGRLETLYNMS